jgi:hypothetical protein
VSTGRTLLLLDFRLSRACPFVSGPFVPCAISYLDDVVFLLSNCTEIGDGLYNVTSLCCCADLCYRVPTLFLAILNSGLPLSAIMNLCCGCSYFDSDLGWLLCAGTVLVHANF